MKQLIIAIFSFISETFSGWFEEVADGIENRNAKTVITNSLFICIWGLVLILIVALLGLLILRNITVVIIGAFLAAALYSVIFKILGGGIDDGSSTDSTAVELAEQEAQEVHEELRELAYNVVAEAADYTSLQRPRDVYSIETSRDKPYRMEGIMAVHQFEVDFSGSLDRSKLNSLLRDVQRRINKHARRYPFLVRDGCSPVIYDIKDNGNFLLLEIVLYSENYRGKIEARKRARIEHQHSQERIEDPRYR